ncbi:hypothetical protein, conserved [Babesia bigemina]|uniref:Uncharacterized protein n=1 Tax=Babesia bigemina TaxID=5866 RepID=A0A061D2I3_BABBI|nr:hypothetical protein, conserved [Babesia bigemina]CDR94788.1 hypothetical protein, conserved [Babesia bigemina]|eukprot:XP_012766974.1 hypothetical protein, conserved [Babesia bigemina]
MRRLPALFALLFAALLGASGDIISDEDCFAESAERAIDKLSQSGNPDFLEEVKAFKHSPFLLAVRYCLGPEASNSSQDFVSCILSFSSCSRGGMEVVDWELCACDTFYCIMRECAQRWLEDMGISDLSCIKPCLENNSNCIVRQTGALGRLALPPVKERRGPNPYETTPIT